MTRMESLGAERLPHDASVTACSICGIIEAILLAGPSEH